MLDSVASKMSVRVVSSFGTVGMEEASLMFSTAMATRFFGLAPAAVVDARTAGSGGGVCGSIVDLCVVATGDVAGADGLAGAWCDTANTGFSSPFEEEDERAICVVTMTSVASGEDGAKDFWGLDPPLGFPTKEPRGVFEALEHTAPMLMDTYVRACACGCGDEGRAAKSGVRLGRPIVSRSKKINRSDIRMINGNCGDEMPG